MSLDPGMTWLLALIGLYAVFLLWYGGRTRPLSASEVQAFLDLMRREGLDRDDPDLYAALTIFSCIAVRLIAATVLAVVALIAWNL